jgi:hypothetical protein
MARTNAPVTAVAVLAALYAAWHFTGGMQGTTVHIHTPPLASRAITTSVTSHCQPLPATTPTPSASPSASGTLATSPSAASSTGTPQLCISMTAGQASVARGKTATWTIQLQAENGPATGVVVTLGASPVGLTPAFTGSCPSGGGNFVCTVGDMGTAVTPASYQLQAQVTVPANATATSFSVTASADTSPSLTTTPGAGQTISITGAAAKTSGKPASTPSSKPSATHSPAPTNPAQPTPAQPVTAPVTQAGAVPSIGAIPTPAPDTSTVAPGDVGPALPQITSSPVIATALPPTALVSSSPAANIQAVSSPTASAAGGDSFSISIGMSAQTAEVLGWILLALVVTLVASKLITGYITRTRQPRPERPPATTPATARTARFKLSRPHLPRLKRRHGLGRAERRATREQNWKRYLESRQPPATDQTPVEEAAPPVIHNHP